MRLTESLIVEIEREGKSTAVILGRVPVDRLDWKPHAKSMSLGQLAWHLASIPSNGARLLKEGKLDVALARPRPMPPDPSNLVSGFQRNLEELKTLLAATSDEVLLTERFSFMRGDEVMISFPKMGVVRTVVLNHSIHHRGQLTVYLRLLEVSVPPMYGTTADESAFS